MRWLWLLTFGACAPHTDGAVAPKRSASRASLDLIRAYPDADKIFVQARLPDGSDAVFLVDTGAGISTVSADVAERLNLKVTDGGYVEGVAGRAAWRKSRLPWLSLGGMVFEQVDVAVDVDGAPESAGFIPVDGIIGNNVWGRVTLVVDYPADRLELAIPGEIPVPPNAQPMGFDGAHASVYVKAFAGESNGPPVERTLLLEVDTGAHGVMLSGGTGVGFESVSTIGEEPILGIGAADLVPVSAFYRRTRRVPLQAVELGGARVEDLKPATWINFEGAAYTIGPQGMPGLIGYSALQDHRVSFHFAEGRFAMNPSEGPPSAENGHERMLQQELKEHGKDASRALIRGKYLIALEREDEAIAELTTATTQPDDHDEARSLLARVLLSRGDHAAWEAQLKALSPAALVEQSEIVALVNGLGLAGRAQEGLSLARAATEASPEEAEAWLARSDAELALGDTAAARRALNTAARLLQNPDADLKRRARIARAEGDRLGALAHLRHRLTLYPSDGEALWFYALTVMEPGLESHRPTFNADLDRAMARLHPEARPLDFVIAALHLVGRGGVETERLMKIGLARDCEPIEDASSKDNCVAWYMAMGGSAEDEALALIRGAVAAKPHRSDYLDTLAIVLLGRGELAEAAQASAAAARLAPDRFYHLWQTERLGALASNAALK
ncbi:MAG: aspartyl protease family protein [Deltaproteobacteria bacterium]|nr:aspartyl protease family protein [Deltaproteobacteria bacterium]